MNCRLWRINGAEEHCVSERKSLSTMRSRRRRTNGRWNIVAEMQDQDKAPMLPSNDGTPRTIPLARCRHGYLYLLRSRNLVSGVFDEGTKGFVGIRSKLGSKRLFIEYHYETGAPFGTAHPVKEVGPYPVKNLRISGDSFCQACVACLPELLRRPVVE